MWYTSRALFSCFCLFFYFFFFWSKDLIYVLLSPLLLCCCVCNYYCLCNSNLITNTEDTQKYFVREQASFVNLQLMRQRRVFWWTVGRSPLCCCWWWKLWTYIKVCCTHWTTSSYYKEKVKIKNVAWEVKLRHLTFFPQHC